MKGKGDRLPSKSSLLLGVFLLVAWACSGNGGASDAKSKAESGSRSVADSSDGKALYIQHCGSCHQKDGSGVPGMYPPLKGTETVKGDKEKLIRIVLEGQKGPIEVKGQRYDREMSAQDHLSDAEVAKILSYVRREFGGGASEVERSEVHELRDGSE